VQEYPLQQIGTALAATATQLGLVGTGYGIHHRIWHTYGIFKHFIPGELPAVQKARQQQGEVNFELINRVHVPIALGSMLVVLVLLGNAVVCGRFDNPAHLAVTVTVAILANAFACGALSGPHDRYGARIVWIATLTAALALLQAIDSFAANRKKAHATAAP
jgi:hypothetical protein